MFVSRVSGCAHVSVRPPGVNSLELFMYSQVRLIGQSSFDYVPEVIGSCLRYERTKVISRFNLVISFDISGR